ncbi:MAG: hypothetical protein FJ149_04625 [Euryarchaeota archaeon]|nr:hypothetical protein [Euryarchaeota archaeon]
MPREEVLNRIREAERQKRELEEEARRNKEGILQKARQDSQKALEDAAAAGEKAAGELIAAEARRVQEERKRMTAASERDIARRREQSRARLAQATGYIVTEFERQLNA